MFAMASVQREWLGVREIRGWQLHVKRIEQQDSAGVTTLWYWAVAKKSGSCAEYLITDTRPSTANPQIKPALVVEPRPVRPCQ
jgi:hypothetical protein